jgi:N-acetylmuramoyl-L-alanine amidase
MSLAHVARPSPNFDERGRPIELLILHYTGMQSGDIAIQRLCDPEPRAGVYAFAWENPDDPDAKLGRASAHYVVEEDGRVVDMVDESKRAWHAGAGQWRGEAELNARSIGIEIVNGGHDFGLPDYPEAQIAALVELVRDIAKRNALKPHQIIGHSDVAPARKADPGEKFPWRRMAEAGLALWSLQSFTGQFSVEGRDVAALQRDLAAIGYGIEANGVLDPHTALVLKAFQRRFRPSRIDGVADSETLGLVSDILRQTRALIARPASVG